MWSGGPFILAFIISDASFVIYIEEESHSIGGELPHVSTTGLRKILAKRYRRAI